MVIKDTYTVVTLHSAEAPDLLVLVGGSPCVRSDVRASCGHPNGARSSHK